MRYLVGGSNPPSASYIWSMNPVKKDGVVTRFYTGTRKQKRWVKGRGQNGKLIASAGMLHGEDTKKDGKVHAHRCIRRLGKKLTNEQVKETLP